MSTVESSPYNYCDVLSVDPLRAIDTGEPRVGITIADDEEMVSFCVSVSDAENLICWLREALEMLAEDAEARDG